VIKPTLASGFDFHRLQWAQARQAALEEGEP
jgi:hypothetical protein